MEDLVLDLMLVPCLRYKCLFPSGMGNINLLRQRLPCSKMSNRVLMRWLRCQLDKKGAFG